MNTIQDFCAGRIVKGIETVVIDFTIASKITFIGTDHYLLIRPNGLDSVSTQLYDGRDGQ